MVKNPPAYKAASYLDMRKHCPSFKKHIDFSQAHLTQWWWWLDCWCPFESTMLDVGGQETGKKRGKLCT
jgi:hypothetical protein